MLTLSPKLPWFDGRIHLEKTVEASAVSEPEQEIKMDGLLSYSAPVVSILAGRLWFGELKTPDNVFDSHFGRTIVILLPCRETNTTNIEHYALCNSLRL